MGPLPLLTNEEEAGLEATGEDCKDEGEPWSWFMDAQSLAKSAMDGPAGDTGCTSGGGKPTTMATLSDSQDSFLATQPVFTTDGILPDRPHLFREAAVEGILRTAREGQYVVIGSSAATGKTALLQLIRQKLKSQGSNVIRISLRDIGYDAIQAQFRDKGITHDFDALEQVRNTWLLLDDAQSVYEPKYFPLWEFLVKDIASAGISSNLKVIIAATYDLRTPGSPVQFRDLPHISAAATEEEARHLFHIYASAWGWDQWDQFQDNLVSLSELTSSHYHLGVVIAGLRLLDELRKMPGQQGLDEAKALSCLRSETFIYRLDRCFEILDNASDEARDRILECLLSGSFSDVGDDAMLSTFVRAGILDTRGQFSNLAAQWYYNRRCFPSRSLTTPDCLDDLVISAVKSLSAKRLRDTLVDGFPKEATFQHLFNEALSVHLPLRCFVIPEFNTFATNADGELETGELDFYINGELQWCLELLRLGDKIGEHVSRFDEYHGKYREINSKSHLVADCRGPKRGRSVQRSESRCTLLFAADFKTCQCSMRLQPDIQIALLP